MKKYLFTLASAGLLVGCTEPQDTMDSAPAQSPTISDPSGSSTTPGTSVTNDPYATPTNQTDTNSITP